MKLPFLVFSSLFILVLSCKKEQVILSKTDDVIIEDSTSVDSINMIPKFPKIGSKWILGRRWDINKQIEYSSTETIIYLKDTLLVHQDSSNNISLKKHFVLESTIKTSQRPRSGKNCQATKTTAHKTHFLRIENNKWILLKDNIDIVIIDLNLKLHDNFKNFTLKSIDTLTFAFNNYKVREIRLEGNGVGNDTYYWYDGFGTSNGPIFLVHDFNDGYIAEWDKVRWQKSELIWD